MTTILRKSLLGAAITALAVGASFATSSAFALSRVQAYVASPDSYESYYAGPNEDLGRTAFPLPNGAYSGGIHYDSQGSCHGWKCDF